MGLLDSLAGAALNQILGGSGLLRNPLSVNILSIGEPTALELLGIFLQATHTSPQELISKCAPVFGSLGVDPSELTDGAIARMVLVCLANDSSHQDGITALLRDPKPMERFGQGQSSSLTQDTLEALRGGFLTLDSSVPKTTETLSTGLLPSARVDGRESSTSVRGQFDGRHEIAAKPAGKKSFGFDKHNFPETQASISDVKSGLASMYYRLNGAYSNGQECKLGSEIELVFELQARIGSVGVIGSKLNGLQHVDIVVFGSGYRRGENFEAKRLLISAGEAGTDRVDFHFKAADIPQPEAGFHVYLDHDAVCLYHFWISAPIVHAIDGTLAADGPRQTLDLDEVEMTRLDRSRDLLVRIDADGEEISYYSTLANAKHLTPLVYASTPKSQLAQQISHIQSKLALLASDPIWGFWTFTEGQQSSRALEKYKPRFKNAAKLGSLLRTFLCQDAGFKKLVMQVESLRLDSQIDIVTNLVGVPWDILYVGDADADVIDPGAFWGLRYRIECFRLNSHEDGGLPKVRSTPGSHITYAVDDAVSQSEAELAWLNGRIGIRGTSVTSVGSCQEKRALLVNGNIPAAASPPSCIYVLCHGVAAAEGSNNEALQLDANCEIEPLELMREVQFNSNPLFILNACNVTAINAFSPRSFSEELIRKGAQGVIGALVPIPKDSAIQFGRAILQQLVVDQQPASEAIAKVRRDWLARYNPVPLFYQLQCPLEARA